MHNYWFFRSSISILREKRVELREKLEHCIWKCLHFCGVYWYVCNLFDNNPFVDGKDFTRKLIKIDCCLMVIFRSFNKNYIDNCVCMCTAVCTCNILNLMISCIILIKRIIPFNSGKLNHHSKHQFIWGEKAIQLHINFFSRYFPLNHLLLFNKIWYGFKVKHFQYCTCRRISIYYVEIFVEIVRCMFYLLNPYFSALS